MVRRTACGRERTVLMADLSTLPPWWRRVPSWRRTALLLPVAVGLGYGALQAGNFYIDNVVPVQVVVDNNSSRGGRVAPPRESLPNSLEASAVPTPTPQPNVLETPGLIAFGGDQERMNILVLGIDYDYTDKDQPTSKSARSDSTMVLSLDVKGSLLNVVSIPRDSRVEMWPNGGMDKLNAAYAYGGLPLARSTVGHFLNAPLDHYVVVNVDAAAKIVDAIGGIEINVEKTMDYDDNWGHLHVHLKKGQRHLTGEQAMGYCRFRHDDESDRGRMRRQQQVIQVLLGKLHDPRIAADIPKVASILKHSLDTDLRTAQILDLVRLYAGFDRKKMKTAQLAGEDAMINDISYLVPVDAKNKPIIRSLLKDPKDLVLEDARIEVLNGAGVSGVARQTADLLTSKGFQVVRVADADRKDYDTNLIVDRLQNSRVRSRLLQALPQAEVEESSEPSNADITVIVGRGKRKEPSSQMSAL